MLFLLNRPDAGALDIVKSLAGDNDKELLLISDAVYLAREAAFKALEALDFEAVYADDKAVRDRGVEVDDDCAVVTADKIVDIMIDNEKVINL